MRTAAGDAGHATAGATAQGGGMTARLAAMILLGGGPALADHDLDGRDIARGATLYAEHCAACHGAELEGAPDWQTPDASGVYPAPPHDETGHTWHHSDAQLIEYTTLGGQEVVARMGLTGFVSGMPGFGDLLGDAEIRDVLAYIRSTWPEDIRAMQATRNAPHD
jgi:mono/diheme cytochrome c family protein